MIKSNNNFIFKIGAVIAILIIVGLVYAVFIGNGTHVQDLPYVDNNLNFSIQLPDGWSVQTRGNSSKVSSVWFHGASSTDAVGAKMAIERFIRTPEMNKTIRMFGTEAYTEGLIESLWVDLDLNILKNERMTIGETPFIHIHSTYMGKNSKREVTQQMYFTFTDNYYYRIGIDAYTDVWEKEYKTLLKSVSTFKVLL